MATKKNIIVGAARTFLGPAIDPSAADTAASSPVLLRAPSGTTDKKSQVEHMTTNTTLSTAWRDVGYTQDGLEVANDPSWGEVEVDQLLDSAKIFKDGMSFTVSTTFAEATLENLLVAWGQADSYATNTATITEIDIEGGSLGEAPLERGLVAVGNAPEKTGSNNYGERTYFLYRVLSVDAVSTTMSRAEAVTIPVSFRCLPADNGKYGFVRDRLGL